MRLPHSATHWTRPRPLLPILKRATASLALAFDKRSLPLRSRARGLSWRSPGLRAYQTSTAAADAYNAEVARRELEDRRLAERAALEALWAQEQAAMALGADARINSMYGGYRLHPIFGGN